MDRRVILFATVIGKATTDSNWTKKMHLLSVV
jgi:hypothetical protein